jgi:hypothetical protein
MSSLALTLNAAGVQVMPGQVATFTVEVRNLGTVVDRYHCDIVGMDPAWTTVTPASIELFPQRELEERGRSDAPPTVGRFTVSVHPPRSAAATAGAWPIGAKVSSEHDPLTRLVEEATVTILPFGALDADLRPVLMGGRFGATTAVHLVNGGNRPEAITIAGTDRAERLDFKIDRPLLTLGPGESVNVKVRISGGEVKIVGGADSRPFTIDVRSSTYDTSPVSLSGTYERRAIVPSGVPVAGATLAALVMGGIAVSALLRTPAEPNIANPGLAGQSGGVQAGQQTAPPATLAPTQAPTQAPTEAPTIRPTATPRKATPRPPSDKMGVGSELRPGQSRVSANGSYRLTLQTDGNLVLYLVHPDQSVDVMWVPVKDRDAPGKVAAMQGDGNFVLYDADPPALSAAIWASHTDAFPGATLIVQNDGNVVLYQAGKAVWASQSDAGCQKVCAPCVPSCPPVALGLPPADAIVPAPRAWQREPSPLRLIRPRV